MVISSNVSVAVRSFVNASNRRLASWNSFFERIKYAFPLLYWHYVYHFIPSQIMHLLILCSLNVLIMQNVQWCMVLLSILYITYLLVLNGILLFFNGLSLRHIYSGKVLMVNFDGWLSHTFVLWSSSWNFVKMKVTD